MITVKELNNLAKKYQKKRDSDFSKTVIAVFLVLLFSLFIMLICKFIGLTKNTSAVIIFLFLLAFLILIIIVSKINEKYIDSNFEYHCPKCGGKLISGIVSNVDVVIASGLCPYCRTKIITKDREIKNEY